MPQIPPFATYAPEKTSPWERLNVARGLQILAEDCVELMSVTHDGYCKVDPNWLTTLREGLIHAAILLKHDVDVHQSNT